MKIRLITFHTPKNYGAVLQGYSLYTYLKNYADDVVVIDYNTPHLRLLYPIIRKFHSLKGVLSCMLDLPHIADKKYKYKKFESFVKIQYALTQRYETTQQLYDDLPQADVYFTGSDQVFGPNRILEERKIFFLDFVPDGTPKYSYAASFGVKTIPEDKKTEIYGYLRRFTGISVREESGLNIVYDSGRIDVCQVLDPVFLNNKEFWMTAEKPYKTAFSHYLFYYRLMGEKNSDEAAMRIAKEKGLTLIIMTESRCNANGKKLYDVGPEEFLYLLSHADFVVTNSFHGVAFSLIYEKQFVFSDFGIVTRERGYDLLKRCGIEKQAYVDTYIPDVSVDYCDVRKRLGKYIAQSQQYVANCIGEVSKNG